MAIESREEEAVRALIERLTVAYGATRSVPEIETAVAAAHASFEDRPVRDFVPVLVERKVRAAFDHPRLARPLTAAFGPDAVGQEGVGVTASPGLSGHRPGLVEGDLSR